MKRIAIYFYYDADGVVDSYNEVLLQDLRQHCERLIVVCNGKLSPTGRKLFASITQEIFVRENIGLDVWAYRTAIEWIGWDSFREYDELIMMNFTNFAPIYPFQIIFEKMDRENIDFWGLSVHSRIDSAPSWFDGSYIPEHLQSHFIAVRKEMLCSFEFRLYWESRPEIKDYSQSVSHHEAIFTEYFSQRGFRWQAYADGADAYTGSNYPALYCPQQMLERYRYPLVKRRLFFHPYMGIFLNNFGYTARDTMHYLQEKTDYPIDTIWENLLRTCNQNDLYHTLHWNRVLPSQSISSMAERAEKPSVAAILYLSQKNCISRYGQYLKNLPQGTFIYLICEDQRLNWSSLLDGYVSDPVEVLYGVAPEQRAEAVFSLLAKIAAEYDYIAVLHFVSDDLDNSRWEAGYVCAESLLATEGYVANVLREFEKDPRLGMLMMPKMYRGLFWSYYGKEIRDYLTEIKALSELLNVPFDGRKMPVSPYYGAFWCRGKAVQEFCSLWEEKDSDLLEKTVSRGAYQFVDCAWGIFLQAAGYYCGHTMCERLAQVELTNLAYHLTLFNRAVNSDSPWHLESIIKAAPASHSAPPLPQAEQIVASEYRDGTVDFTSIPRGVMVRQTLKKFCPSGLWNFLKKLFKRS